MEAKQYYIFRLHLGLFSLSVMTIQNIQNKIVRTVEKLWKLSFNPIKSKLFFEHFSVKRLLKPSSVLEATGAVILETQKFTL